MAPLYDYECSFESSCSEIYRNQVLYLNMHKLPEIFKKDAEYQENLYKIRDANMNQFIKTIEGRHGVLISSDIKEYYKKSDKGKKRL